MIGQCNRGLMEMRFRGLLDRQGQAKRVLHAQISSLHFLISKDI